MKNLRTFLKVGVLAGGLTAFLAACGTNPDTTTTAPAHPERGGTLTVALSPETNIDWYLPIVNAGADSVSNFWLLDQIYKPLIYLTTPTRLCPDPHRI